MSKVMIYPATYENVAEAVEQVFRLFPMELQGKKVFIKPNLLRPSNPSEGIITHPAVLRAVVEKVESLQPASIVVGDNPGVFAYGENERSFRESGLMDAAMGHYENIGNDSREIDFNPDFMPRVSLSRIVLDADIIISLPKFKTHGLTVITGAIKNSYGFLPGAQKAGLHKAAGCAERFHEVIVEVFRLRPPDLFIMDAVVGMEGNGPASPDLRDIGLILASDNAVALDSIVATMMGLDPGRLRFLEKAKETGLGDYDLNTIEIIGKLKKLSNFKLPPLSGEVLLDNKVMQDMLHTRAVSRPQADPRLCTACGVCIDSCPVTALSMAGDFPQADADTCIACFCCQELCPEKAMVLK